MFVASLLAYTFFWYNAYYNSAEAEQWPFLSLTFVVRVIWLVKVSSMLFLFVYAHVCVSIGGHYNSLIFFWEFLPRHRSIMNPIAILSYGTNTVWSHGCQVSPWGLLYVCMYVESATSVFQYGMVVGAWSTIPSEGFDHRSMKRPNIYFTQTPRAPLQRIRSSKKKIILST